MTSHGLASLVLVAAAGFASCEGAPPVRDYEKFYAEEPFTVVVLPVRNQTADAEAPRYFISTITKPLVDRGYYVIPVEATADILAAEGLGDGGALADVPASRFHDYFGADAVFYVTLVSWDTSYLILASSVTVAMEYQLVSTHTSEVLWETVHTETISSGSSGGGLIGALIDAAVTAAATDYVPLAAQANFNACSTLPAGPYNERFEAERADYLERARKAREAKEKAEQAAREKQSETPEK